jgi:hypothetical protein
MVSSVIIVCVGEGRMLGLQSLEVAAYLVVRMTGEVGCTYYTEISLDITS